MAEPEGHACETGKTFDRGFQRLFLDDDPARAEAFLEKYPDAHWVQNVVDVYRRTFRQKPGTRSISTTISPASGSSFRAAGLRDGGHSLVDGTTSKSPDGGQVRGAFAQLERRHGDGHPNSGSPGITSSNSPSVRLEKKIPGLDSPIFEPARPTSNRRKNRKKTIFCPMIRTEARLDQTYLRWFVPPPTVSQPWNRPPGFEKRSRRRQVRKIEQAGDLRDSEASDDTNEPKARTFFRSVKTTRTRSGVSCGDVFAAGSTMG